MIRATAIARLAIGLALAGPAATHAAAAAADAALGGRLYSAGLRADGSELVGTRLDGLVVKGAQAACSTCHRPSGMGGVEGDIQVPPITGHALYGTDKVIATMDPRSGKAFNRAHDPYTDEQLARMLRTGLRPDGTPMNALMPRYELGGTELHALLGYLRSLSANWSPGADADTIHLATVITPDVPEARRALFRDMVQKIVAQKNGSTKLASSRATRHHMTSAAEMVLGTERRWQLDVWELQGAPSTWGAQLDALQAKSPVFALVSGLGGDAWQPVDDFCNRRAVPCWFPSVAAPPTAPSHWALHFSGGLSLEAAVLASHWQAAGAAAPARVLQVSDGSAAGQVASAALAQALAARGTHLEDLVISGGADAALAPRLAALEPGDAVVFWLPADGLAALAALPAPRASTWFSGTLGGASRVAVPAGWRAGARVLFPWELPARRAANLAYFRAWLNQRHVPLEDEEMQSEVYFSFAFLTDTLAEMLDNLYGDYLIERAESMINRREGGRAESEYYSSTASHVRTQATMAQAMGRAAPGGATEPASLQSLRQAGAAFGVRSGTTAYPRLTLGAGQRFASKGAYVARIADDGSLQPDGEWIVP